VPFSDDGKRPDRKQRAKHFFRRWAIMLGGGYILVCFVMWLLENNLVFHPSPASAYWEEKPDAAIQDVRITSPGGIAIHAWWLPNKPDDPVLLLCPGNAGNLSGRGTTLVGMLEMLGVSVLIFDYPGYGKSEGKPSEAACYDAADGAIAWLKSEKKIPTERVILYGESLGGGVATEMATRHPSRALVLVKTFTLLPAVAKHHYPWLPVYTISKLPTIHSPVFIASAAKDQIVPYEHGEANFRAANEPKQFLSLEGSDHNDPLPAEFWIELNAFLDRIGK
jgi:uncharacterized protein